MQGDGTWPRCRRWAGDVRHRPQAGIYDLRLHHDEVVSPILRFWKVFDRTDFGPVGEQAREELAQFLVGLDAQATKFVESRERMRARIAARGQVPIQV